MAFITGPDDVPHGRVIIMLERYEAEALAALVCEATNVHYVDLGSIDTDALNGIVPALQAIHLGPNGLQGD